MNVIKFISYSVILALSSLWLFVGAGDIQVKCFDYEFTFSIAIGAFVIIVFIIAIVFVSRVGIKLSNLLKERFFNNVFRGFIFYQLNNHEEAAKRFRNVYFSNSGGNNLVNFVISQNLIKMNKLSEARNILVSIVNDPEVRNFALVSLAQMSLQISDLLEVERILNLADFDDKRCRRSLLEIKKIFLIRKQNWKELYELEINDWMVSYQYALTIKDSPIKCLKVINSIKIKNPLLVSLEAKVYFSIGENKKALELIEKFYKSSEKNNCSFVLADAYLEIGGKVEELKKISSCDRVNDLLMGIELIKSRLYIDACRIFMNREFSVAYKINLAKSKILSEYTEEGVAALDEIKLKRYICRSCLDLNYEWNLVCSKCHNIGLIEEFDVLL